MGYLSKDCALSPQNADFDPDVEDLRKLVAVKVAAVEAKKTQKRLKVTLSLVASERFVWFLRSERHRRGLVAVFARPC